VIESEKESLSFKYYLNEKWVQLLVLFCCKSFAYIVMFKLCNWFSNEILLYLNCFFFTGLRLSSSFPRAFLQNNLQCFIFSFYLFDKSWQRKGQKTTSNRNIRKKFNFSSKKIKYKKELNIYTCSFNAWSQYIYSLTVFFVNPSAFSFQSGTKSYPRLPPSSKFKQPASQPALDQLKDITSIGASENRSSFGALEVSHDARTRLHWS